jgi:hypothetical protein
LRLDVALDLRTVEQLHHVDRATASAWVLDLGQRAW